MIQPGDEVIAADYEVRAMLRSVIAGNPDNCVSLAAPIMLVGVAGFGLCLMSGGLGILTTVQIFVFGLSCSTLSDFRRERGLWMLAGLWLGIWGSLYGLGITMEIRDALRGVAIPLFLLADVCMATLVTSVHLRFLWKTAQQNRLLDADPRG